jgi:hypothetical protein
MGSLEPALAALAEGEEGARHRIRAAAAQGGPGQNVVLSGGLSGCGLFLTSIPSTIHISHNTDSQAIGNDLTDEFMVVYLNL